MTTVQCTGEFVTFTKTDKGNTQKTTLTVEHALRACNDCDVIESITRAWQNKGEVVTVPNISFARGQKPRNAQRHGVIQ